MVMPMPHPLYCTLSCSYACILTLSNVRLPEVMHASTFCWCPRMDNISFFPFPISSPLALYCFSLLPCKSSPQSLRSTLQSLFIPFFSSFSIFYCIFHSNCQRKCSCCNQQVTKRCKIAPRKTCYLSSQNKSYFSK